MAKKKTNTAFLKMAQAPLKPSPRAGRGFRVIRPHLAATGCEKSMGIHQET